ncbi:MAG: asparagine synthase (glutamine-hydrolyzing) [Candidatus Paceibacterota bacterium]|jgi:asparagine synthase (glutamine-hydrolysing)
MCGIAGQYCIDGKTPNKDILFTMSQKLAHRGPDGNGIYLNGNVGLVHRRLAIIDLTEDGAQPMSNEDGSLIITFNGEIYNYIELREELIKKGYVFKSGSDTEVIIHAYEEWGSACVNRFNGMWAFALWDSKRQELFCARDRFGIKPFYYTRVGDSFFFASEIKALPKYFNPNDKTVNMFLAWGMQDYCEETMFDGVYQIEPGFALTVSKYGISKYHYWIPTINENISGECNYKKLRGLINSAVRLHLRSDVPVGSCLSGGIDSSVIVSMIDTENQKTFSAVFGNEKFDESKYINEVIKDKKVDCDFVEPTSQRLIKDIDDLIYIQDEPFGSLSIYAQYCVMRSAKDKVKVLLDGQGADELFAGYLGYQVAYIKGLIKSLHLWAAAKESVGFIRRHHDFIFNSIMETYARKRYRKCLGEIPMYEDRYKPPLSCVLERELISTNLPALLHYEDRNSMVFSIEARVPYLDIDLIEYVTRLPLGEKIRNGVSKFSLRNSVRGIIPESIRTRKDKMGFVTPEEMWMKNELQEFVQGVITSESFRSRKYWDWQEVKKCYDEFVSGEIEYSWILWRTVCTELWLRRFIDKI